jgi:hypothetical protein
MSTTSSTLARRHFLQAAIATAGGAALAGPFGVLGARAAAGRPSTDPGYGPLRPTRDQRGRSERDRYGLSTPAVTPHAEQ